MVAINTAPDEDKHLADWRKKGGYTCPVLRAEKGFALNAYQVSGAPTNLLLDSDRCMVFRHLGYHVGEESRMEAEIRELLGLDPFPPIPASTPSPDPGPRSRPRESGWQE